jgi:hypothetical protein
MTTLQNQENDERTADWIRHGTKFTEHHLLVYSIMMVCLAERRMQALGNHRTQG